MVTLKNNREEIVMSLPCDVIIVGGGPAGYTAGLYSARAGLRTLLFTGATTVSQITVTDFIENYPGIPVGIGGFELLERFQRQALNFGLKTEAADVVTIERVSKAEGERWRVTASGSTYDSIAVIIATGASWRKLGIPGEETFAGRGVSYCATCDGPFFRNRPVIVVGGGNAAIQEAIFLTRFASQVTVVHRRDRLRATAVLQKRAFENPRITFVWRSVVEEIMGRNDVEGAVLRDVVTGEKREVAADGVFIFVGLIPNTAFCRGVVDLAPDGAVIVDREMRTSAPGIFACGDCTNKTLRQVVTACGDGATAAYAAQLFVEETKGETYP